MAKKVVLEDNNGNKCYPVTRDACILSGNRTLPERLFDLDKQYIFANNVTKRNKKLIDGGYFNSILDASFYLESFDSSKEYGLYLEKVFADTPSIALYTLEPLSRVFNLESNDNGDILLFKDASEKSYVLIDKSKLSSSANYSIDSNSGVELNKRLFYNSNKLINIEDTQKQIRTDVDALKISISIFIDLSTGEAPLKGINFVKELYIPNKEEGKVYWIDWIIKLNRSYGYWFGVSKGSSIGSIDKENIGTFKAEKTADINDISIITVDRKIYAVIDWSIIPSDVNTYGIANIKIEDTAFNISNSPTLASIVGDENIADTQKTENEAIRAEISKLKDITIGGFILVNDNIGVDGAVAIKELYLMSDIDFSQYDYVIESMARNNDKYGWYIFISQYEKGTTTGPIVISTGFLKDPNTESITILPLYLHPENNKVIGYVVVDWKALEDGRNYLSILKWVIKENSLLAKNSPMIFSYIEDLKQNQKIDNLKTLLPVSEASVIVADKLYAVVGDTLQLFYKGIFNALNLADYEIRVLCDKGKAYPRYFEYTPTSEDIGEVDITFSLHKIVDIDNLVTKEISSKTCKLITSDKLSNPDETINILHVGDSTIGGGSWPREIKRRFSGTGGIPEGLGLANINVCGRLTGIYEGVNYGWEGTGGWTWSTYINRGVKATRFNVTGVSTLKISDTYRAENGHEYEITEINVTGGTGNIRCVDKYLNPVEEDPQQFGTLSKIYGTGDNTISYTSYEIETFSPFINQDNNEVDFQSYADKYCNGRIDILITSLGINSIFGFKTNLLFLNGVINDAKTFIRKFHEQFPNGKFGLSTIQIASQNGGFAANYGASSSAIQKAYERNVFALNKAYQNLANEEEFRNYVFIVDNCSQVDPDYSYPTEDKKVNTRTDITEKVGTNAVHFVQIGANMIADSVYRFITYSLS